MPPFGGSEKSGRSLSLQIVHLYNEPNPDQIVCLEKFKETLKSKFLFLFISQTRSIAHVAAVTLSSLACRVSG